MPWTALAWLALDRGGGSALGLVAVCYTAPVVAGGAVLGPLLDRFPKRALLLADSVTHGAVVLSVPACAALGGAPLGLLLGVALAYGPLKMLPLAAVPARRVVAGAAHRRPRPGRPRDHDRVRAVQRRVRDARRRPAAAEQAPGGRRSGRARPVAERARRRPVRR